MVENMDLKPIPKKRKEIASDAQLNCTVIVYPETVAVEMEEMHWIRDRTFVAR
jgi:hypothetical protein